MKSLAHGDVSVAMSRAIAEDIRFMQFNVPGSTFSLQNGQFDPCITSRGGAGAPCMAAAAQLQHVAQVQ